MSDQREVVENLMRQGRWELALREVDRLLSMDPNDGELLVERAWILARMSHGRDARDCLAAAIAAEPENAYVHYIGGRVLLHLDLEAEALAAFDESIRLWPEYCGGYLDKAAIYCDRARLVKQCHEIGLRRSEYPRKNPPLRTVKEENQEALELIRQAIQLDPDESECHRILALILVEEDQAEAAIEAATTSLKLRPDKAATHEIAGDAYLKSGQHEAALGHFIESKRLDPTNEEVRQKVVDAFSHHNWLYRVSMMIINWMLAPIFLFSYLFDRPGAMWVFMIGAGGMGFVAAMLGSNDEGNAWEWVLPVMLWLVIGPALLGAVGMLLTMALSRFALQFTRATRRWLSPSEVWMSNMLMVILLATFVSLTLLILTSLEAFMALAFGVYIAATANPIGIYMANRLSTERFRTARFAIAFVVVSLVIPTLLMLFEPFRDGYVSLNFTLALVWFIVGLGLFWQDVQTLTGNPKP